MPKLTFRNSQGELVDISSIAATGAKTEFGAILERAALGGAVVITRHNAPKAVLIAYSEFESLVKARDHTLEKLGAEFDQLMADMQTPKAKKAMDAAFNASSAKLGRAALKAANKDR